MTVIHKRKIKTKNFKLITENVGTHSIITVNVVYDQAKVVNIILGNLVYSAVRSSHLEKMRSVLPPTIILPHTITVLPLCVLSGHASTVLHLESNHAPRYSLV